jgi:outer membrane protein OmpA-like peptidoglycan-associated protein
MPKHGVVQRTPDDRFAAFTQQAGRIKDRTAEIEWSKTSPGIAEQAGSKYRFRIMNFAINSAKLKPEHIAFLEQQVYFKTLSIYPMAKVRTVGHASKTGGRRFNLRLSKRRAAVVRKYLMDLAKPVSKRQLRRPVGKGYSVPYQSNATAEGRAKNRRVEIEIVPSPAVKDISQHLTGLRRGKRIAPFTINVSNLSKAGASQQFIKTNTEAVFAPLGVVKFDWTGASANADGRVTFTTAPTCSIYGLTTDIASSIFYNCIVNSKPPFGKSRIGRAFLNVVCHEIGHIFKLDEAATPGNYMFTGDKADLRAKIDAKERNHQDASAERRKLMIIQSSPCSFTQSQYRRMLIGIQQRRDSGKGVRRGRITRYDFD